MWISKSCSLEVLCVLLLALNVLGDDNGLGISNKIKVDFFMESRCPSCSQFTTTVLKKLWDEGLFAILDFSAIPYGNAHEKVMNEYTCQHGIRECEENLLEVCAIHLYPSISQWFPFFYCFERYNLVTSKPNTEMCANEAGMSGSLIEECAKGSQGKDLMKSAAKQTNELEPKHTWVPWLVVAGTPLANPDSLPKKICELYQGDKPPACQAYLQLAPKRPVLGLLLEVPHLRACKVDERPSHDIPLHLMLE
eukprot:CAMPEP_0196583468 /NCGR_PEP_ID=MMETSP1081-20130531/43774_1 /TAXON_ID=36882 /ORGANISM="Pyramimonas amylifera, Strain CCMP720" /LENGTH=250 /DNA_ID=CAMNT_0041904375 /DNA_START=130 /DNA_END=882 /DNA_ORIENTATION=-